MFLSRFFGSAVDHLQNGNTSPSSQFGLMLAVILIKNASLEENIFPQGKLLLTFIAEATALSELSERKVQVDSPQYDDFRNFESTAPQLEAGISLATAKTFYPENYQQHNKVFVEHVQRQVSKFIPQSLPDDSPNLIKNFIFDKSFYSLHLNDDFTVLKISISAATRQIPS